MLVDLKFSIGNELANKSEILSLAFKYHLERLSMIQAAQEGMWNNSQSDEGWKKDRVPEEH